MTGFVRVQFEDGSEASVSPDYAELQKETLKLLEPNAEPHARALPASYDNLKGAAKKAAAAEAEGGK